MAKRLIVPASVSQEIMKGPAGDPARQWIQGAGARLVKDDAPLLPSILTRKLGAGESAVLAHALTLPGCEAIIDDLAARRAATALAIPFRGTLGVILTAKRRGLIVSATELFDL